MYAANRKGLGVDWGEILNTSITTVGEIFTGSGQQPGSSPQYPISQPVYNTAGPSLLTLAAVGIGAFLLVRAMK